MSALFENSKNLSRRSFVGGALALGGTSLLSGCGGTTGGGDEGGEDAPTGPVELIVWGPQEDQSGDVNWLQTECEAFAEAHPEWDISFTYGVCSEGDAKTQMATDAEAAADVYMFANDQIPDLITVGAIAELGGSTLEQIKANNSETVVNTVTFQDGVYGVPFTGNTWFMYYNKSIFSDEDAQSLDAMLEKGKVSFPLNNAWYLGSFYVGNGCTIFGEGGTDEEAGIDFSGDKATAVTDYLIDLAANPNFVNDADGAGIAGLTDGSIGAIFSGSWDYGNVSDALGENMGIAVPPTYTLNGSEVPILSFAGSKAIGVNANCANPQVAVALAAHLGSTEAQQSHYDARNIIPTDVSLDMADDPLAQVQADTMDEHAIVQPVFPGMAAYWDPAANMGNEIIAGTVTHDNAAEKTEAMNEALNSSTVS